MLNEAKRKKWRWYRMITESIRHVTLFMDLGMSHRPGVNEEIRSLEETMKSEFTWAQETFEEVKIVRG